MYVCMYVYRVCARVCCLQKEKRLSDSLKLELGMGVSHHVDAEN